MSCLCKNCFNLRLKIRTNVRCLGTTSLTPINKARGLIVIYCRKGNLLDSKGEIKLLFSLPSTEKLCSGGCCPDFAGEVGEVVEKRQE